MQKVKSNEVVRAMDTGAGDNWSVFVEGATGGNIDIQVAPRKEGPFVTAKTVTADGAYPMDLSRLYFIKIDLTEANEIWIG